MWFVSLTVLIAVLLWATWKRGPRYGLGCVTILSLLVPIWVSQDFAGQPLDVRIAAAIAGLSVYVLHPEGKIRTRLILVDYLGLGLLAVHLASDWTNDGFSWGVLLRAYGEWFVPYVAARLALRDLDDVRKLLPVLLAIASVVALHAVWETFFRVNLFEWIFGARPTDEYARGGPEGWKRWGWTRASGPTNNPIFLGAVQLLLLPWALFAAVRVERLGGWRIWRASPGLGIAGIAATLSRAPVLGIVAMLYATATVYWQRARPYLIGGALLGTVLLATQYRAVLGAVQDWGGDASAEGQAVILLDGKEVPFSNTLYRLHVFKVYGRAMARAGLLGFGTEATDDFPVNVPVGVIPAATLRLLWSVDNQYILITLRFGWSGLLMFTAWGLAAVATLARMAVHRGAGHGLFEASLAGAIFAVLLVLTTVHMPHDIGFWLLWSMGIAAGLRSGELEAEKRRFAAAVARARTAR